MSRSVLPFFLLLGLASLGFVVAFVRDLVRVRREEGKAAIRPTPYELFVGALTDFLDTLGIGSFATTSSLYRLRGTVADELLPGTMNVGHTLPTVTQALIYVVLVAVDRWTLALLVGAATLGGTLGAGVVTRFSRRGVRLGMGVALLLAAGLLLVRIAHAGPSGGDALGLEGASLVVGALACFVFGALMTIGVGAYAPILVTVSLLGMDPTAAFPIMMGACAFVMPAASSRFVARRRYAPRAALGLTLGGVPAVLVAAFVVRSLPLDALEGLVLAVVLYTSLSLLRAAREPDEPRTDRV
ncbi:MAG: hypothetical protein U0230_03775 [Polyangiales bacterium]